jgi:hypothetical protein
VGALLAAPAPAAAPQLTASVTPAELALGSAASVSGVAAGAGAGAAVVLQSAPYPYSSYATVATGATAADGSFAFPGIHVDRNTRLRVQLAGGSTAPVDLQLFVDTRASLQARSLGPGHTLLSLRIRHAVLGARAVDATVRWFLAAKGSRVYHLAAESRADELRPGLLSATVVVNPPARSFTFRACVNPSWERAMGPPDVHRRCPETGFVLHVVERA